MAPLSYGARGEGRLGMAMTRPAEEVQRRDPARPGAEAPNLAWKAAYGLAQGNAVTFLVLSALFFVCGVTSVSLNTAVAILFFAGSLWSFQRLAQAGGGACAISYFVLGAGVYFGFGTAYSVIGTERAFLVYFNQDQKEQWLRYINLLNAASVFVVLLFARWQSISGPAERANTYELARSLPVLGSLRLIGVLMSLPIIAMAIMTFPRPQDPLLANLSGLLKQIPIATILISGIQWGRMGLIGRGVTIGLVTVLSVLGLLALSKTDVLIPVLALFAGLLLGVQRPVKVIPGMLLVVAVYVMVFAPLVALGRAYPSYRSDENTLDQRAEIVAASWQLMGQATTGQRKTEPVWNRVGQAHVQAFLIQDRANGHSGHSFESAWAAMIPRAIWPEKPIVTRFGEDLDSYFARRSNSGSALAPTYTGEIYWNLGWVGVVWVSALIGLELGWLTAKWNRFTRDPATNFGILVFAVPAILLAARVETWVVSAFVGGFITLVVSIKALDKGLPVLAQILRSANGGAQTSARPVTRNLR